MYCLAIHPPLVQLNKEFRKKIKVLAFADDVHFLRAPKLAVAAMARWEFLYGPFCRGKSIKRSACATHHGWQRPFFARLGFQPRYLLPHGAPESLGPQWVPMSSASTLRVNASRRLPMTLPILDECHPSKPNTACYRGRSSIDLITCDGAFLAEKPASFTDS